MNASASETASPADSRLKDIALFLASPFFGLFYIVTFPLYAGAMVAWMIAGAFGKQKGAERSVSE